MSHRNSSSTVCFKARFFMSEALRATVHHLYSASSGSSANSWYSGNVAGESS